MSVQMAKLSAMTNMSIFFLLVISIHMRLESNEDPSMVQAARGSLIHDVVFAVGLNSLCWMACVPGVKAGNDVVELLHASSVADSVLNHTLKNSIAGVITLMEVDKQENPSKQSAHHEPIARQLYRSMRWCASRQLLTDLVAERYVPVVAPVDTRSFIQGVVEGRDALFDIQNEEVCINFNETMAWLALDNAVSNAVIHGRKGRPVRLAVRFDRPRNRVYFTVTNDAGPKNGTQQKRLGNDAEEAPPAKLAVSTKAGLKHTELACRGAGGGFDLKLEKDVAVFTLWMPATKDGSARKDSPLPAPPETRSAVVLPEMLKVHAIDDSKMICKGYERILLPRIKVDKAHSSVSCPKTAEDVAAFIDTVLVSTAAADVVILDQNIELNEGADGVLGTDLALQLRSRHFGGLIAIRSANAETSDVEAYKTEKVISLLADSLSRKYQSSATEG